MFVEFFACLHWTRVRAVTVPNRAMTRTLYVVFSILLLHGFMVKSQTYDKKILDGMLLKMLWEKVYVSYDAKQKEMAIKKLRSSGEYDHLLLHLQKVKKEKVKKIINLIGEVMIIYMT